MSFLPVYSDEAIAEVNQVLNSRNYYVGSSGQMNFSAETDVIKFVLNSMTGD